MGGKWLLNGDEPDTTSTDQLRMTLSLIFKIRHEMKNVKSKKAKTNKN
jgi:hypothetical protein